VPSEGVSGQAEPVGGRAAAGGNRRRPRLGCAHRLRPRETRSGGPEAPTWIAPARGKPGWARPRRTDHSERSGLPVSAWCRRDRRRCFCVFGRRSSLRAHASACRPDAAGAAGPDGGVRAADEHARRMPSPPARAGAATTSPPVPRDQVAAGPRAAGASSPACREAPDHALASGERRPTLDSPFFPPALYRFPAMVFPGRPRESRTAWSGGAASSVEGSDAQCVAPVGKSERMIYESAGTAPARRSKPGSSGRRTRSGPRSGPRDATSAQPHDHRSTSPRDDGLEPVETALGNTTGGTIAPGSERPHPTRSAG
jgi:hypothetical protein